MIITIIFNINSLKEISSLKKAHNKLKLKLSKLNDELNQKIDRDFGKIKNKIVSKKEEIELNPEKQKGYYSFLNH